MIKFKDFLTGALMQADSHIDEAVWDSLSPSKHPTKLSDRQKTLARARAKSRNRPYPNLIDNMWVSQQ